MSKTERKNIIKQMRDLQGELTRARKRGDAYGEPHVDRMVSEMDRLAMMLPENQW